MRNFAVLIYFMLISVFSAYSQEAEPAINNLQVNIQISAENPVVGKPWIFTITIDYPEPEEVIIAAPSFGSLSLERLVKSPRLTGNRLQTVFDYTFIPNRTGRFVLESFAVICPSGMASTEPYILNITAENEEQKPLVLRLDWKEAPSQIEAGERAILSLHSNIGSARPLPHGFFMPEVPAGLIISPLQLTEEEITNGTFAKFNFIPLNGDINFASRSLQFENTLYEIPALQIKVSKRTADSIAEIPAVNSANPSINNEEDFFLSGITDENKKRRIIRLGYFYSILFLVIIIMFICLYLLLRKK